MRHGPAWEGMEGGAHRFGDLRRRGDLRKATFETGPRLLGEQAARLGEVSDRRASDKIGELQERSASRNGIEPCHDVSALRGILEPIAG